MRSLDLLCLLRRRTRVQPLQPCRRIRVVSLPGEVELGPVQNPHPGHEAQVRVRKLIVDEVLLAGKDAIEDADNALGLVTVALDCTRELPKARFILATDRPSHAGKV